MKKVFYLSLLIALFSCETGPDYSVHSFASSEEAVFQLGERFKLKNIAMDENRELIFPKKTYNIVIPRGATLSLLGEAAYKDLAFYEEAYGFGGIKSCYEIMSEINGIYNSRYIMAGDTMKIYSLGAMEMEMIKPEKEPNHLISRVMNNQIKIKSIRAY